MEGKNRGNKKTLTNQRLKTPRVGVTYRYKAGVMCYAQQGRLMSITCTQGSSINPSLVLLELILVFIGTQYFDCYSSRFWVPI